MKEDKKLVKQARQNFRSNLKSARMHYRKEVRTLRQTVPKKRKISKISQKFSVSGKENRVKRKSTQ